MSNKKKLIPALRFPEFKEDGEWAYHYGNKLFQPISNKNHDSDLPILAITQDSGAIPRELIDYTVIASKNSVKNYKIVEKGDFIISLRSFQGGIEYSSYRGICSPAYIILRKRVELERDFYKYYFKTPLYIQELNRNLEGIRDGKMVSYSQFSEIYLPFPPLPEQQKIADCLSSLDDLLAAHNEKLELLKGHKKGLMQNLFPQEGERVPKFRFPEFENDGEWEEKKLGEVGENLDSRRVPITSTVREKGDIPYYGASGIIDFVKDHIFDEELLLISEDGANLIARTYPIAFTISGKTWVNNHAHVLRFNCWATQVLVENYLNSRSIEDFLTGMAQPKLNRSKLDIIPISLPNSLDEQQKIASCLSAVDDLIKAETGKIEALKGHKKGLMQGLFPKMEN